MTDGCMRRDGQELMDAQNFLERDLRYLKGVGERRAELFAKLGIGTVGALLRYYPRSYLNLLDTTSIAAAPLDTPCAVRATVYSKTAPVRVRGGKTIARVHAGDGESDLEILYFNNKYGPNALKEGQSYLFYGKLSGSLLSRQIINPTVMRPEEVRSLIPQYPQTEGLSSRVISATVRSALELADGALAETLPPALLEQHGLVSYERAVHDIHFPPDLEAAHRAKERLIFEELLTLSLGMQLMKSRAKATTAVRIGEGDLNAFARSLPYSLTGAQIRAIKEIARDLEQPVPMSRLLQGDVGSGKTVCAAAGVFRAVKSGYQAAVMAPTEILAAQHAETFARLLEPLGVSVGLLTGAVKGKARAGLLARIESGQCDLVVGTHALLGDQVVFHKLGFVVADEQHRFGVEQRAGLARKGERPHLLVMSATPIPRTLALIIYGDLDVSVLDELPAGRRPVKTYLVGGELRARYLGFVRRTVDAGHQAYIVCPLVEESDAMGDTLSATEYSAELSEHYLRGLRVGLVHGRMKAADKAAVMDGFARGEIQVLVSTTVIEVGVDVPNATLMIIENSERFGLSALHQLRGRVGRGAAESFCVLVSSSGSETARARLSVMTRTNDGFEIARQDLKTRGPGDFFGKRQHGLPALHVADLADDEKVLYAASEASAALLAQDPALSSPAHAGLAASVQRMFRDSAFN